MPTCRKIIPASLIVTGGFLLVAQSLILIVELTSFSRLSFVDEILYIEPAYMVSRGGNPSLPAAAQQLDLKGVPNLDSTYHITTPINWLVRVPAFMIFKNEILAKNFADLYIKIFFLGAFVFALRRAAVNWPLCVFATGALIAYKFIGFSPPGRPDILCAAFGMMAVGFCLSPSPLKHGALYFAGIFAGLSFLTHQFGGVLFSMLATVSIITSSLRFQAKQSELIRSLFIFVLGGFSVGCIYGTYILADLANWKNQFFWLVNLKKHLSKSPIESSMEIARNLFARSFPAFLLLSIVLLANILQKKLSQRNLILLFITVFCFGIIWRLFGFEHYNHAYNAYFYSMIFLIICVGLNEISPMAQSLLKILILALLILSFIPFYFFGNLYPITSTVMLPHKKAYDQRKLLINSLDFSGSKLLVDCILYFEVPYSNKIAMAHHEKMDLKQFDYIITSYSDIPVIEVRDQYFDSFTQKQKQQFDSSFALHSKVPPVTNSSINRLISLISSKSPTTTGMYIFKRNKSVD